MSENPNQAPPLIEPPFTPPPASPPPNPEAQARTWNMLCHLSALAVFLGVPFGNILGPLLVWQIQKDKFPTTNLHGKAALNFQITLTIALVVGCAAAFVGSFFCLGLFLVPVIALIPLAGLIITLIAGIKANNGETYAYPWTIEFVK